MADLLSSLEIGITRKIGAASLLRDQVNNMDGYMHAQRQQNCTTSNTTYPSHPNHQIASSSSISSTSSSNNNPNIDPNLQGAGPGSAVYGTLANSNPYDYTGTGGVNINGTVDEQFQFQLPPELLEGWPWPFNIVQGFGGF